MRVVRRKIVGDQTFTSDTQLFGMVTGSAAVASGVHLEMLGMVCRSLTVRRGSTVELRGTVIGDVINDGGHIAIHGVVEGRVLCNGGTTSVDPNAVVKGGVIRKAQK